MQLYSKEKNVSQPIEGHSASFASLTLEGATSPSTLFTFASKTAAGAKVHSRHLLPAPPAYRAHNARRCAARCAAWSWGPCCWLCCGRVRGTHRCVRLRGYHLA